MPVDFERLGSALYVFGTVFAQRDGPNVQSGARLQRHRQRRQLLMVGQHEAHRIGCVIEQQQHAVGLANLAAAPRWQQVARGAVMRCPNLGHRLVTKLSRKLCAVDNVGQKQGSNLTHFVAVSRLVRCFHRRQPGAEPLAVCDAISLVQS